LKQVWKLRAFAPDYDGTIAIDGRLDSVVRCAIAHVCARCVVVENGAVIEFPDSEHLRRHDWSLWISDTFRDTPLGSHLVRMAAGDR
jgi:hypothetical protein